MGPGNHVLDGVQIPHGGKGASHCKEHSAVTCAKTAEPMEMPFSLWARKGPRNHVLDGGQDHSRKGQFWEKGAPIVKYRDFLP